MPEKTADLATSNVELRNGDTTLDDKTRRTEPERDPIEAALADALLAAVDAGRFDVVSKLADELQARRLARINGARV